jgi:hypothetical protein
MNLKHLLATSLLAMAVMTAHAAGSDSFFGATLQMQDGKPLVAETLRGKPLVVLFWERDCDGCAAQTAELAKAEIQQRTSGLKALGVLIDKRAESIDDPSPPVKSPLSTAVTDFRKGLWLMQNLGNPGGGVPFVVVFDRNGQIVARSKRLLSAVDIMVALTPSPK